ncbi:putative ArsR family transcriptional regulator [Bacillus ectoiniformans]|uniref:helix-turn-helix transcriptional regulator n=1 Tax=Bacillus ectoiniformans TaxID=1494429 RepID=UPI001956B1A1|nr:helix-turn-helix domain-containing protein [Bacillus ectoiniformans]MBM7650470.1 putative ArsR family transcriptional regulator [Bacillus ectoiniformans]
MEHTLKLTSTLADPTRFSIYQHMVKQQKEVSVQEIAEEFHIHPNVARLHLSKLEEINIVESQLHKTGKGGRPGRLYKTSEQPVQLSFPYRDFQLLSSIALSALSSLGEAGKEAATEAAYKMGGQFVQQQLGSHKKDFSALSQQEKEDYLQFISSMIGYYPKIEEVDGKQHISLVIYNCPFKESMKTDADLSCKIHTSFLEGAFSHLFNQVTFTQTENMKDGCQNCIYHLIVTN